MRVSTRSMALIEKSTQHSQDLKLVQSSEASPGPNISIPPLRCTGTEGGFGSHLGQIYQPKKAPRSSSLWFQSQYLQGMAGVERKHQETCEGPQPRMCTQSAPNVQGAPEADSTVRGVIDGTTCKSQPDGVHCTQDSLHEWRPFFSDAE